MKPIQYYSHGKLLITGEYLVMDGALSLALPVKFGQDLSVTEQEDSILHWKAVDPSGTWFEAHFLLPSLEVSYSSHLPASDWLKLLLEAARQINPGFLSGHQGFEVVTRLNYNRNWGMGSSSTLISNLSAWAGTDPWQLFRKVSGGSGYDIACARANGPLLYRLAGGIPSAEPVHFLPDFREHIGFVYLGQKQDSAAGIREYRKKNQSSPAESIAVVSGITEKMISTASLEEFMQLMDEHESLISGLTGMQSLKQTLFSNFSGAVKSLGAWGGDFAMIVSRAPATTIKDELKAMGLDTFFTFDDLILQPGM